MHIGLILQSSRPLFVFNVSLAVKLQLERNVPKKKGVIFLASFCLLEHTANVFTLVILIFSYVLLFNLLRHGLLSSLFEHFTKIFIPNSKKTLLYVCFFSPLHTIFLVVSAQADSCDLLSLFTKSFVAVANLHD
jgi:hypothetical protein